MFSQQMFVKQFSKWLSQHTLSPGLLSHCTFKVYNKGRKLCYKWKTSISPFPSPFVYSMQSNHKNMHRKAPPSGWILCLSRKMLSLREGTGVGRQEGMLASNPDFLIQAVELPHPFSATIKNPREQPVLLGIWRKGTLVHHQECGLVWLLQKTVWSSWKNQRELPHDPAIPHQGLFPKEMKGGSQRDICTVIFIAALFTIAAALIGQAKCVVQP